MHCKTTLSDDFVLNNTNQAWRVKQYKGYRENLLYEMEQARLPNTQVYAEIYQKARDMKKVAMEKLATIKEEYDAMVKPPSSDVMACNMRNWAYTGRIHEHHQIILYCKNPISSFGLVTWGGLGRVQEEKRLIVKACITNGCNGFLDDRFSCGLCMVKVCRDCHESLADEHVCNADTVATIKAIKAEARGCPRCATLISKIDGCDQMWCTQCHATFSWRTGQVEAGHTHNPHYYEFMRQNGGLPRAPGDFVACEVFPTLRMLHNAIKPLSALDWYKVLEMHKEMIHVEMTIRQSLDVQQPDNHDLRVQLLSKDISVDKMKATLQMRDKAYRKNLAKNQIYLMAYTVGRDLFRSLIVDKNVEEAKKALEALFVYSNECLDKVAKAYSCKVKHYTIV
jgi:hypothetical protein